MEQQIQLLKDAKTKLGVKSDYALAKALEIPTNRISDYMKGRRVMDEYAMFRLAVVLEESPTKIIAQVLANTEKSENRRLFFSRFFSIAASLIILGTVFASCITFYGSALAAGSGDISVHYAK